MATDEFRFVRVVGQTYAHRVPREQLVEDPSFDKGGYFLRPVEGVARAICGSHSAKHWVDADPRDEPCTRCEKALARRARAANR